MNERVSKPNSDLYENLNGLIKAAMRHSINFELFLFLCYWLVATARSLLVLRHTKIKDRRKKKISSLQILGVCVCVYSI